MKIKILLILLLFFIPGIVFAQWDFSGVEKEISNLCYKSGHPLSGMFHNEQNRLNSPAAALSTGINKIYPGSNINCLTGSGIFVIDAEKIYFVDWKVIRATKTGENSLDYEVSEYGKYLKVSDGKNYLKFDTIKKVFIDVNLPLLAETATIVGVKQFVGFKKNELMSLLDEFYVMNSNLGPIDHFADALLLNPSFREEFLTWSEQYLQKPTVKNNNSKKQITPQKTKWEVNPEQTAKCLLDLKKIIQSQNAADEVENFQNTQCGRTLKISEKYLDKDIEFTDKVDNLMQKGKK